jgi:hypothetical protein
MRILYRTLVFGIAIGSLCYSAEVEASSPQELQQGIPSLLPAVIICSLRSFEIALKERCSQLAHRGLQIDLANKRYGVGRATVAAETTHATYSSTC